MSSTLAYDADYRGGLRVATGDFIGDQVTDVVVNPATRGQAVARLLSGPQLGTTADYDLASRFPGVFVG